MTLNANRTQQKRKQKRNTQLRCRTAKQHRIKQQIANEIKHWGRGSNVAHMAYVLRLFYVMLHWSRLLSLLLLSWCLSFVATCCYLGCYLLPSLFAFILLPHIDACLRRVPAQMLQYGIGMLRSCRRTSHQRMHAKTAYRWSARLGAVAPWQRT